MEYFFVYMLKCVDNSYYIGHSDNIEKRIEAIEVEHKIKKWSRKKKEALINQDWDEISKLAKKKFKK